MRWTGSSGTCDIGFDRSLAVPVLQHAALPSNPSQPIPFWRGSSSNICLFGAPSERWVYKYIDDDDVCAWGTSYEPNRLQTNIENERQEDEEEEVSLFSFRIFLEFENFFYVNILRRTFWFADLLRMMMMNIRGEWDSFAYLSRLRIHLWNISLKTKNIFH